MRFTVRKRRQTPTIIIVSLIDVLIVVLIFLMVTTTFKQQPAVKLALPETRESKTGASDQKNLIITIPKEGALHLGAEPLTLEKLQQRLTEAARNNPDVAVSIRADTQAPFGQIVKVMDAVKSAHIKSVNAFTKGPGSP